MTDLIWQNITRKDLPAPRMMPNTKREIPRKWPKRCYVFHRQWPRVPLHSLLRLGQVT